MTVDQPKCSVIMIGNPGAGKSAILNALGGDFYSGFSAVCGVQGYNTKTVELKGRTLELVDLPGIADSAGKGTTSDNLRILQESLNSCEKAKALLFFVITPTNGRICSNDFAVVENLLQKLIMSPTIGLFVTQVRPDHIPSLNTEEYRNQVLDILRKAGGNTNYLESNRWCILKTHGKEGFSDKEKEDIANYVISFDPEPVKVGGLIERIFQSIIDFFKNLLRF
ncbi:hypothetical protein FBU30_004357 [Linnemannia zychae]|nr:hypothetical protein FBU30_004357 [Linnemannia zychae]